MATSLESLGFLIREDDRLPPRLLLMTGDDQAAEAGDRFLADPLDLAVRGEYVRQLRKRKIVAVLFGEE